MPANDSRQALSFDDARKLLDSANQKGLRQVAAHVLSSLGVRGETTHDAVTDWGAGAQNSVVQVLPERTDPATTQYLAAWMGLLHNQRGVVIFDAGEGNDSCYAVDVKTNDPADLRSNLDHLGLRFRTIVPTDGGYHLVIFDPGRKLRDRVAAFARGTDARVREARGRGNYLGGATRAAARSVYRRVIARYESGAGTQEPGVRAGEPALHAADAGAARPGPAQGTPKARLSRDPSFLIKFAGALRAPKGGAMWRGLFYPGGKMMPGQQPGPLDPSVAAAWAKGTRVRYAADEPTATLEKPAALPKLPPKKPPFDMEKAGREEYEGQLGELYGQAGDLEQVAGSEIPRMDALNHQHALWGEITKLEDFFNRRWPRRAAQGEHRRWTPEQLRLVDDRYYRALTEQFLSRHMEEPWRARAFRHLEGHDGPMSGLRALSQRMNSAPFSHLSKEENEALRLYNDASYERLNRPMYLLDTGRASEESALATIRQFQQDGYQFDAEALLRSWAQHRNNFLQESGYNGPGYTKARVDALVQKLHRRGPVLRLAAKYKPLQTAQDVPKAAPLPKPPPKFNAETGNAEAYGKELAGLYGQAHDIEAQADDGEMPRYDAMKLQHQLWAEIEGLERQHGQRHGRRQFTPEQQKLVELRHWRALKEATIHGDFDREDELREATRDHLFGPDPTAGGSDGGVSWLHRQAMPEGQYAMMSGPVWEQEAQDLDRLTDGSLPAKQVLPLIQKLRKQGYKVPAAQMIQAWHESGFNWDGPDSRRDLQAQLMLQVLEQLHRRGKRLRLARRLRGVLKLGRSFAPKGGLSLHGNFYLPGEELPDNVETLMEARASTPAEAVANITALHREALTNEEQAGSLFRNKIMRGEPSPRRIKKIGKPPVNRDPLIPDPARRGKKPKYANRRPSGKGAAGLALPDKLIPPELEQHLLADEKDQLNYNDTRKLVKVFNSLPPDALFEKAARAGTVKRGWYRDSADALTRVFGTDTPRFVALLAGTSPRVSVQENFARALTIWKAFQQAGGSTRSWTPEEVQKLVAGLREKKLVSNFEGQDRLIEKALTSTDPGRDTFGVLSQQGESAFKVDSFRRNLLGQLAHVTNDVWMSAMGEINQKEFSTPGGYMAFNAKVRRVAERMNQGLGKGEQEWQPAEIQETIWSFFRALTMLQGRSRLGDRKPLNATEALAKLTSGDVAETVDFIGMMLKDKGTRTTLKELGYGKALKALARKYRGRGLAETEAQRPAVAPADRGLLEHTARESSKKQNIANRVRNQRGRRLFLAVFSRGCRVAGSCSARRREI